MDKEMIRLGEATFLVFVFTMLGITIVLYIGVLVYSTMISYYVLFNSSKDKELNDTKTKIALFIFSIFYILLPFFLVWFILKIEKYSEKHMVRVINNKAYLSNKKCEFL